MSGKLGTAVRGIDLFQQPVSLFIRGQRTFGTTTGGILSVLFATILIGTFIQQIIVMVNRSNSNTSTNIITDTKYPGLVFDQSNFTLAIKIIYEDPYDGSEYIMNPSVPHFYISITWHFNGTDVDLGTQLCDDSNELLSGSICPMYTRFNLQGKQMRSANDSKSLASEFSYLEIKFTPCGTNCDNYYGTDINQYKVYVMYTDNNYDANANMMVSQLAYDYQIISITGLATTVVKYVDSVSIGQDLGYFTPSLQSVNSFAINDAMTQTMITPQSTSSPVYFRYSMYRSPYTNNYQTSYTKFTDVLSTVGGLSNALLGLFGFLAVGYSQLKYQVILSNEIYNFEQEEKKKPKKQLELQNLSSNSSRVESESSIEEGKKKELSENVGKYFLEKTDPHTIKKSKITFGFWDYLKVSYCKCCVRANKAKLMEKAFDSVTNDIDIVELLKKVQDIDKLKTLLLTENQQTLFNFTPRPVISAQPKKKHRENRGSIISQLEIDLKNPQASENANFESLDDYLDLYESYLIAKKDTSDKKNAHLIKMLGEDLLEVFREIEDILGPDYNELQLQKLVAASIKRMKHKN